VPAGPVKGVARRRESFVSDIHAREQTVRVDVAAAADGTLTAMRATITAAVGPYSAYPRSSVVEGGQVLRLLPGPYRLRHYDATLRVVAQNKVVTSQYRAVGHPIATAVTESMVDLIARDLELDPVEVRRQPGGAVTALVGVTNQGQGTHTALSQIIADELDVPLDQIAVLSGDTAVVPYGGGTWASRGMPIGGSATMLAARALGEKIRTIAAGLLEAHAGDIELRQGRAEVRGR